MKVCQSCGNELLQGHKFCAQCGNEVEGLREDQVDSQTSKTELNDLQESSITRGQDESTETVEAIIAQQSSEPNQQENPEISEQFETKPDHGEDITTASSYRQAPPAKNTLDSVKSLGHSLSKHDVLKEYFTPENLQRVTVSFMHHLFIHIGLMVMIAGALHLGMAPTLFLILIQLGLAVVYPIYKQSSQPLVQAWSPLKSTYYRNKTGERVVIERKLSQQGQQILDLISHNVLVILFGFYANVLVGWHVFQQLFSGNGLASILWFILSPIGIVLTILGFVYIRELYHHDKTWALIPAWDGISGEKIQKHSIFQALKLPKEDTTMTNMNATTKQSSFETTPFTSSSTGHMQATFTDQELKMIQKRSVRKGGLRPFHLVIVSTLLMTLALTFMGHRILSFFFFMGSDIYWIFDLGMVGYFLFSIVFNAIYYLPAMVAKGNAKWIIFLISLLFNWTILIWVGCLIWAFMDNKRFREENEFREMMYLKMMKD